MEHLNATESLNTNAEKKDSSINKKIRDRIVMAATMLTSLFAAKEGHAQYTYPAEKFTAVPTELFAKPGNLDRVKNYEGIEKIDKEMLKKLEDKFAEVLKDKTYKFEGVGILDNGDRVLTTENIKDTLKDGGLVIDEFEIVETKNSFHIMGQLDMVRYRGEALKTENPDVEATFTENDLTSQDVDIEIDKETGVIISFIKGTPYNIPQEKDSAGYEQNKKDMDWFVIKNDGTGASENYFQNTATRIVQAAAESTPKENAKVTQEYLQSFDTTHN